MRGLGWLVAIAAGAAALAHRPTREAIGHLLITAGCHLACGPPPELTPEQEARMRERVMEARRTATSPNRNGRVFGSHKG